MKINRKVMSLLEINKYKQDIETYQSTIKDLEEKYNIEKLKNIEENTKFNGKFKKNTGLRRKVKH